MAANPGSIPEIPYLTAGLARAGVLRAYVSPFGGREAHSIRLAQALAPNRIRRSLHRELQRRALDEAVPLASVINRATFSEAAFVMSQRGWLPPPLQNHLLRGRNVRFDHAVAAELLPTDHALVTASGVSLTALRRCRELRIRSFLACPIAHHGFAQRILQEEKRLQPKFAATLQYHDLPSRVQLRLDAELALADEILVLSSFQQRTFVEEGVEEKRLTVIPPGVDTDLFCPGEPPATSPFRIIFVGQLTQRKGLSYLLEAFHQFAVPEAELVLVGRPWGPAHVWSLGPKVTHVSHVPRWQLPSLYRSAHVFVLPSLVEGFALTALEAMACGLPVILSSNTFGNDLITDGREGFVVPIRDSQSILRAIRQIWENPAARLSMGECARRRAEQFSWRRYADSVASHVINSGLYR